MKTYIIIAHKSSLKSAQTWLIREREREKLKGVQKEFYFVRSTAVWLLSDDGHDHAQMVVLVAGCRRVGVANAHLEAYRFCDHDVGHV